MTLSLRRIAASAGQRRYVTGIPCKHGHVAERFTSSGACTQCVTDARKAMAALLRAMREAGALDTFDGSVNI